MIKNIILSILLCIPLLAFTQTEAPTTNQDSIIKEQLINSAHKKDTVEAYVLYLDSTSVAGGDVVVYNDEVRFMFTYEQVQKINSTYRLVDIMNEVIEKYGTEKDFSINIIEGLNEEITLLNAKIKIKDGKIANQERFNKKLMDIIEKHEAETLKKDKLLVNKDEQITNLKDENKKLKLVSKLTGGSTILLIICVLVLI